MAAILAQQEDNARGRARARGRDQGGSSEAAGSTRQAGAGRPESGQAAPSADVLADGGGVGNNNTNNNHAGESAGAGSSTGAGAGISSGGGADTVGDDGPSTTKDEDLALVGFFKRSSYLVPGMSYATVVKSDTDKSSKVPFFFFHIEVSLRTVVFFSRLFHAIVWISCAPCRFRQRIENDGR